MELTVNQFTNTVVTAAAIWTFAFGAELSAICVKAPDRKFL